MPDFQASFYLHTTLVSSPKEPITLASNRGEKISTTIVISQVQQARVLLLHFIFFSNLILPPLPTLLLLPPGIRLRKEFMDGMKACSSLLFHGVSSAFGSSAIGGCFFFLLVVEQLLRLGFLIRVSHDAAAPYHVFESKNGRRRFSVTNFDASRTVESKANPELQLQFYKAVRLLPRNNPPPKQQQTKTTLRRQTTKASNPRKAKGQQKLRTPNPKEKASATD